MKKKYLIFFMALLGFTCGAFAQITFFGCSDSFTTSAPNEYNLTLEGTDASGRNFYQSNPISGDQSCAAGVCEFRMAWNDTQTRWEILLFQNNIDFSDAVVVYYNNTAASPNPPSLNLGNWVDATGNCGGQLAEGNGILTGSVQDDVTLSNEDVNDLNTAIQIYPNPAQKIVYVRSNSVSIKQIALYSVLGKLVKVDIKNQDINVSNLAKGIYLLKVETTNNKAFIRKVVVN
ncbi:hypothetical protein PK35_08935 [Tamlana nanhaiensis]|uniref:Secretion system C-terminal sorting domain-containing protein n=1 Tax=Neotamlana nanhaiensis TaxID=1382798 RepID=A0A0D7W2Z2_9FLAO|nr:T9SS type A sorting domain-containing protein [Tamlana nanhaiensis]KJD33078.1 hypothetical protein PK35_08935 [Tamlana nanhaiensis]